MIKIPHNRAIQLLEARLKEVDTFGTDLKALKNRLQIDVEGIFGRGSTQAISVISLDTLHFEKPDNIAKCKTTFRQSIQGWINYIKDFHIIGQEQIEISEQEYKVKYTELLKKWNDLVPEYNELLKNYEATIGQYDEALSEIRILQDKLNDKEEFTEMINIHCCPIKI